jgi:uncharacterized membrane protein
LTAERCRAGHNLGRNIRADEIRVRSRLSRVAKHLVEELAQVVAADADQQEHTREEESDDHDDGEQAPAAVQNDAALVPFEEGQKQKNDATDASDTEKRCVDCCQNSRRVFEDRITSIPLAVQ